MIKDHDPMDPYYLWKPDPNPRSQHSALGRQLNTSVGKERPYLYSVTAPDLFVCHLKIRGENPTDTGMFRWLRDQSVNVSL